MTPFEVKNIGGYYSTGKIHLLGSGRLLLPLQENDWIRTNFALFNVFGVHFGYLVAAIRVLRTFRSRIRTWPRVLVTGYSLGGSVAEVLGVLIARIYRIPVEIHNFGGPAPWSRRLPRGAIVDCTWYHAGLDVIPFSMFWNRHIGTRKHLPYDGLGAHITGYSEEICKYLY